VRAGRRIRISEVSREVCFSRREKWGSLGSEEGEKSVVERRGEMEGGRC